MSENENIEAKLCSYVEGDLDAQGRAEIEKYLLAHPQYRSLIAELGRTRGLLHGLPRESAPAELLETLSGQIERSALLGDDDAGSMQIRPNRFGHLAAWAAVLVLTGGLAAVIYHVLPSNKSQQEIALLKPAPPMVSATQAVADDSIKVLSDADRLPALQAPVAVAAAIPPAATAPTDEPVAAVAAAQPAPVVDAPPTTAPSVASADAIVISGGTTVASASVSQQQSLGSIVGGDATQSGQKMYLTLHATDAAAAHARVTQYLSNNGIQYESRAMNDGARLSSGPLPPSVLPGNKPQNYAMSEGSDSPIAAAPSAAKDAVATAAAPAMHAEDRLLRRSPASAPSLVLGNLSVDGAANATAETDNVIVARNLTADQAKRLASDLDVKVLPSTVNFQPSTQPLVLDGIGAGGGLSDDSLLQPGQTVRLVAREKLLPDVDAMNETQTIDADGNLTLPLVGKIQAAGQTAAQLSAKIPRAYRDAKSPTDANWTITPIAATEPAVDGNLALSAKAAVPTTEPAPALSALASGDTNAGVSDRQGIDVTIHVIGQRGPATAPAGGEIGGGAGASAPTTAPISLPTDSGVTPAATMPATAPNG